MLLHPETHPVTPAAQHSLNGRKKVILAQGLKVGAEIGSALDDKDYIGHHPHGLRRHVQHWYHHLLQLPRLRAEEHTTALGHD